LVFAAFAVTACEQAQVMSPPPPSADIDAAATCNVGDCEGAEAAPAATTEDAAIGAINPFFVPTAAYTGATGLIDISGIPNFSLVSAITGAGTTVSLGAPPAWSKRHAEVSGWATWGDPPFTEVFRPHVLFSTTNARTLTMSVPCGIFGFELEPNSFLTFPFTAVFYSGGGAVPEGSITRPVTGFHGARLFAAQSTGGPIDRVDVLVRAGNPFGFAIGRVRCQREIRVRLDIKPGSFPNSINPKSMGVVPVAILGTPTFDVRTVDVTTLAFGPSGAMPKHDLTNPFTYADHLQDVNSDGFTDLVSHYPQKDTGLAPGDTSACLTGKLRGPFGAFIKGCDSVRVLGG
jgi:hypothetical protein